MGSILRSDVKNQTFVSGGSPVDDPSLEALLLPELFTLARGSVSIALP
jgi:hypothetical protein